METLSVERSSVPVRELAADFNEPYGLDILDSSLRITAVPVAEGGVQYTAAFDRPPLEPQQFHMLLRAIAPGGAARAEAINNDWILPDEEEKPFFGPDLLKRHEQLGEAWRDFMKSRKLFMAVMEGNIDPTNAWSGRYNFDDGNSKHILLTNDRVSVARTVNMALRDKSLGLYALEPLFAGVGLENTRRLLLRSIADILNQRRHPNRQLTKDKKVVRQFDSLSRASKEQILAQLPNYVPSNKQEDFLEAAKKALFDSFIAADGQTYYVPKADIKGSLAEQAAKAKTVRIGDYAAEVFTLQHLSQSYWRTATSQPEYTSKPVVVPGSLRRTEPVVTIQPHLKWHRQSNGDREFIIEAPLQTEAYSYLDNVLGVLAIAYCTPEARQNWPKTMKLGGSRRKQELEEAQVPVLALLPGIQKQLLNSKFIIKAEKIADQAKNC